MMTSIVTSSSSSLPVQLATLVVFRLRRRRLDSVPSLSSASDLAALILVVDGPALMAA